MLISDGVATQGSLSSVLDDLKSRDIPVDVLPVEYQFDREVWLERLDLPPGRRLAKPESARGARERALIGGSHEDLELFPVELSHHSRTYSLLHIYIQYLMYLPSFSHAYDSNETAMERGKTEDGMEREVLVVGANGRIGRWSVEAFLEAGWKVRAFVRTGSASRVRGGVTVFEGDALGNLNVKAEQILERDLFVIDQLRRLNIPVVMLLSGGYSSESYKHVFATVKSLIDGDVN